MLSLVMPYYMNPRMLSWHLRVWRDEWSASLKDQVEIVIVDDGSPAGETAEEVLKVLVSQATTLVGLPKINLYRVLEDRPWHQHGARNLGAHVATGKWMFMTDMDHVVPASTMVEILRLLPTLHESKVLTFGRVDAPATLTWKADHWTEFARTRRGDGSLKPHANSFVVRRDRYWKLGGYDEDLCGIYGTDKHFRSRLFGAHTVEQHVDYAPIIRVDRNVIHDASTRNVDRNDPERGLKKRRVHALKQSEGRSRQITTLNFPWERVVL
jgi:hypothetical protein